MKKMFRNILFSAVVAGALVVSAGAAHFDAAAQSLKDVGLFAGTNQGFELDRAPDRAEAATMLVRLLGKADEAAEAWTEKEAEFPFTDMENYNWAKPYVSWLYENKLTAGSSATAFDPDDKCSAQMYATFLLRALGYSDAAGGDFTYADALAFAQEKGVVDMMNCDAKNFLRDHVAAMSYTALAVQPKDYDIDLLTKLMDEGAVEKTDAAQALEAKFDAWRTYNAANAKSQDMTALEAKMLMAVEASLLGESMQVQMDGTVAAKVDPANLADMEMKMDMLMASFMSDEVFEVPVSYYFADGVYYMDIEGEKVKMDLNLDELLAQMQDMMPALEMQKSHEPLVSFDAIEKTVKGSKTVFDISYDTELMQAMVDKVMDSMMDMSGLMGVDPKEMAEMQAMLEEMLAQLDIRFEDMNAVVEAQ